MNASDAHVDVASYALGVLDPRDMERFEDHLVSCDACALELESLLPAARMLSVVDREAFAEASHALNDGRMFDEMRNVVAFERKRKRFRSFTAAAAAAAVTAAVSLTLGIGLSHNSNAGTNAADPPSISTGAGKATLGPQETPTSPANSGTHYAATDPLSGAVLDAYVTGTQYGSKVSIDLGHVKGPLKCNLLVVGKDGTSEQVGWWSVAAEGYGTQAHPDLLSVSATSSMKPDKIGRIEIRAVSGEGGSNPSTLVAVKL